MTELPRPLPLTVLHIGAHGGDRWEQLYAAGAERVLLVEPSPVLADELKRRAQGMAGVRILTAGVAAHSGRRELATMNWPNLSSLRRPTEALHALFPGLRTISREEVPVVDPASLLAELGEIARPFWLIVDAPGQEMDILAGLKSAGALDQIDRLELRCGAEVFYEGSAARPEIETWLADEYFVLDHSDEPDPDWPVLHLRADHSARALQIAKARIAVIEAELQESLNAGDQRAKKAEDRVAELESALAEATATADARAKELTDTGQRLEKATERGQALDKKVAQLESALAEATAAADARAKELTDTRQRLEKATERGQTLDKKVAELQNRNASLTDEVQRTMLDIRRARQDLAIALRQQDRQQAELSELRSRFETEKSVREDQADLLRQLTPRLREAARQLQTLSPPETAGAPALPTRCGQTRRKVNKPEQ